MFNSVVFLNTVLFVCLYEVGKISILFIKVFQKGNCKLSNVSMVKVKRESLTVKIMRQISEF